MSGQDAFKPDLLLVDGRHALWRAADRFNELSVVTATGETEHTGAVYGFLTILCKMQAWFGGSVIICWDDWENGPAHRLAMFPAYKNKRHANALQLADGHPRLQDEAAQAKHEMMVSMLVQQGRLMSILAQFGIPQAYSEGWEADDVLGTLAKRYGDAYNVGIFSGDRDMYQCVTERVKVIKPVKGGEYQVVGVEDVIKEYEIHPSRFAEMKALAGDTGDNIPGIHGIGPKTAAKILTHFETAEEACAFAQYGQDANAKGHTRKMIPGLNDRMEKLLAGGIESARLSKRLATINTSAPLGFVPMATDVHLVTQEMVKMKFKTILIGGRLQRLFEMGLGLTT